MICMSNFKTAVRLFICGILAVLLAACGGQAESDALISATQNQFYARSAQLSSAQEAVLASATTVPETVATTAANAPAVEPIPAMEIPTEVPTNPEAQAP